MHAVCAKQFIRKGNEHEQVETLQQNQRNLEKIYHLSYTVEK